MRVTTVETFCRVNPGLTAENVKAVLLAFGRLTSDGKRELLPAEQEAVLEDARGTVRPKVGRPRGSKNKPEEVKEGGAE